MSHITRVTRQIPTREGGEEIKTEPGPVPEQLPSDLLPAETVSCHLTSVFMS